MIEGISDFLPGSSILIIILYWHTGRYLTNEQQCIYRHGSAFLVLYTVFYCATTPCQKKM